MSMKILMVHNYYQQGGGEDVVVMAERELLQSHGHDVRFYSVSNDAITGIINKIKTAWATPYSSSARIDFAAELASFGPDVVHAHNLFPLLSPSIYDACRDAGVPVVQTLHNFRTVCPGALLLRDDKICEECLTGHPYRAVLHRCYRGSLPGSLVVARMVEYHRKHGTWQDKVDCFIALTDFVKAKFVQANFPAEKITVKPNFLFSQPETGKGEGGYALFVGRLSQEKGVSLLLEAWERLAVKMPLKIVGDGPLSQMVAKSAGRLPGVEWLGRKSRDEVLSLMKDAVVLVFPSIWYEGFPMTILEAYAVGLPVIAGDIGSMSSLIKHKCTGLHFRAGECSDLVAQVEWAMAHPAELTMMRREARAEFEANYTAEKNYTMLIDIYRKVTSQK